MCAAQAAAALVALIGASAGLGLLDPIAALVVAAIAARESVTLWQGRLLRAGRFTDPQTEQGCCEPECGCG